MGNIGHALLSASGSERWLKCTRSPLLETEFKEEKSLFAEEGTLAHELGESYLNLEFKNITKRKFNSIHKKIKMNGFYSEDMEGYIKVYVDFIKEKIEEIVKETGEEPLVFIEKKLSFDMWVPYGFGTGDVVIIDKEKVYIIDLKYGRGVPVKATENTQMQLYGLGAIQEFEFLYDFKEVEMTIVQPRLNNISTYNLEKDKLIEFGEKEVIPKANLAIKGEGEFNAGEHCRFCKARFSCRERAKENLKLAKYDFKDSELLVDSEIEDILLKLPEFKKWISDIETFALDKAINEEKIWSGFKLARGKTNRKYGDEKKVGAVLIEAGYGVEEIYKRGLQNITYIEKLLGKEKFNEIVGPYLTRTEGKLNLVFDKDIENIKNDFK